MAMEQTPCVPEFGTNVDHKQARKAIAAAVAESRKLDLPIAITIVDNAGTRLAFARIDNTQTGSVVVSQDTAISVAMSRRPTKVFQDVLASACEC